MKLSDLAPNPENPRQITDERLLMLSKALAEFGDLSGIVFNRRTGHLVGGHQRQKALPGDAEVVVEATFDEGTRAGTVAEGYALIDGERFKYREVDWDETKEMAANIAANKHGGEWNLPALNTWLLELDAANIDMDLTGFTAEELEDLMAPVQKVEPKADEDSVPGARSETISKPGDIWQLGRHRLMCGDSTVIESVELLLAGTKPNLLFTDPPYGIAVVHGKGNYGTGVLAKAGNYSPVIGDESTDVAIDAVNLCLALDIPLMVVWGANYFASALPDGKKWLVWDKLRPEGTTFSDCELAWTNIEGGVKKYEFFWHGMMQEGPREQRVHPTQKPVGLIEKIFADFEGEAVLDLFGGSGSTLIACEKLGRSAFLMELDPKYVDVIVARWEKFTGQKAVRLGDDAQLTVEGAGA